MKRIFQKYQEATLIILAVLFLGILVAYFIWGTTALTVNLNKAISIPQNKGADSGFNIDGAQKLDFRGAQ